MILLCFDTSDVNQVMKRQWASFMKHEQNEFLCKSFVKLFWRKLSNSWKCLYIQNVSWYKEMYTCSLLSLFFWSWVDNCKTQRSSLSLFTQPSNKWRRGATNIDQPSNLYNDCLQQWRSQYYWPISLFCIYAIYWSQTWEGRPEYSTVFLDTQFA